VSGPELHVSGGGGGTDAHLEDLATLARNSDDLALTLGSISAECHTMLADPDVVASAVLGPGGVTKFGATLLGALDGRGGLTALSVKFGQRAIALRAVAASYQATDEANRLAIDSIRWTAGYMLADNVGGTLALLGTAGAPLAAYTLLGGKIDYERLLTDHPGIVDNFVGISPGLISGLGRPLIFVSDVPGAAHLVGLFYPDGRPMVADGGVDTFSASMRNPPRGFGDLMDGLDYRNGKSQPGEPDQIDVRVITHADGSKAYIVDLPGTKVWNLPGSHNPTLNDLGTNVHSIGADLTTREKAIADALHRAGANSTDPVMLVGHSQGGICRCSNRTGHRHRHLQLQRHTRPHRGRADRAPRHPRPGAGPVVRELSRHRGAPRRRRQPGSSQPDHRHV
jgi:hypothetical protein